MCKSNENVLLEAKPFYNYLQEVIAFSNIAFLKDPEKPLTKFEHFDSISSNLFKEAVNMALEKDAPTKKKYVWTNQAPFTTKRLSKKNHEKVAFEKQIS